MGPLLPDPNLRLANKVDDLIDPLPLAGAKQKHFQPNLTFNKDQARWAAPLNLAKTSTTKIVRVEEREGRSETKDRGS